MLVETTVIQQSEVKPKRPFYKKIIRFFLWTIISCLVLIGIAIALVVVYEDEVKEIVIKELNKNLKTEVRIDPKNIDLTFVSSFPKCAIEFKNITAMESWQKKEKDTLLFAESLSLKFDLKDLFNKKYIIKQIVLKDARCNLKVDKSGAANYIAWETEGASSATGNDSLQFKLEDIEFKNARLIYKNKQQLIKTDFTVDDLTFAGNFTQDVYELVSKGNLNVRDFTIGKVSYVKNKKLKLDVAFDVNGNSYVIKKSEIALNEMLFNVNGKINYADSLQLLKLDYKAKKLDISSILSLLPEKYKAHINDYKSDGEFFANGDLSYETQKPFSIHSTFGINKATIEYTPKSTKLTGVELMGELVVDNKQSFLKWNNFNANLNGDNVKGSFLLDNFKDPFINVSAVGAFNLQNLFSFWPIDTLESLEGNLKFSGDIKGALKDIKQNTFSDKLSVNLDVELEKLKTKFKNSNHEIAVESCHILAKERDVKIENFKLIKGKTDLKLDGEIPGIFNYILDSKAPLLIRGKLSSNDFQMEDLIFSSESSSGGTESEFNIPANINLVLDANINHFSFGKFEASNISGNFELKNQKALVSDMVFETMDGQASVDAFADASGKELEVTLQSKLKGINVKKMFTQLNNFGQTTLLDKNINGVLTATIDFSGKWDKKLSPELNSITSTAEFTIDKGELNDFKPLESLSKFVELKELKRIQFSSLTSELEIKNSKIIIPKTTIKNSVLNIDFNGTHTFNNDIDYHIRLLISDLLAKKRKNKDDEFGPVENDPENHRSAFILMSGNIDNPVIKYDRQGLKQKIKDDIKQEKQNIKQILREEFGSKKDTVSKPGNKANQKFELEKPDNKQPKKPLEPKKKEEDDDF